MINIINFIYSKSPIFIQNTVVSLYGIIWKKRRFGGIFEKKKKEFRARNYFTKHDWCDYQTKELRKILVHAFKFVPFYTEKYKSAGFSLEDFEKFNLSDIYKLPYLEKDELRKYGKTSLLSINRDKGHFHSSSGSTGTPTSIFYSNSFHQNWSAAFEIRIREWAGLNNKFSRGTIGGRRIVTSSGINGDLFRYNRAEKQVYFSAYHISRDTVLNYLDGMHKHKIDYMTGYAMSNYYLACLIEKSGFKAPKLKAVITSSEKLTSKMRDTFSRVYGCKTYDSYSGVEACGLISENEHGQLLFSPDTGIMEFLNQKGEICKAGEEGEIISTGFLNYDQPLIRYRIGDTAKLAIDQINKCGRSMTIVDEIIGRVEDKIIGNDGREMVRFHSIFTKINKILEAQIIQHETTIFEIKVVVDNPLNLKEKQIILNRMTSQLGSIELNINEVSSIARNSNGKFKAVISKIKYS